MILSYNAPNARCLTPDSAPKRDEVDVSEHKKHFTATATELAARKCNIGALYRKTIYLDCDLVVNLDIAELWHIDVNDCCMAGVFDVFSASLPDEALLDWINGCSVKTFINSGVLVMNLKNIRRHGNLFQNSMAWIERHVHLMRYSDQDVLNNLFYRSIKLIDERFNRNNPRSKHELPDSILHTPGGSKTWKISGNPAQRFYWHYYLKTAWGEEKSCDELVDIMFNASFLPEDADLCGNA